MAHIPATFFVVGQRVAGREWTVDELTWLGHTVGNHSRTHPNLAEMRTPGEITRNVAECRNAIEDRVTDGEFLFRAPYGAFTTAIADQLNSDSATRVYTGHIDWAVGGTTSALDNASAPYIPDWQCWNSANAAAPTRGPLTPAQCGDIYLREILANRRGIVLMHDRDSEWPATHSGQENVRTAQMVE